MTLLEARQWCSARHQQRRGEECYGFTAHVSTTNTSAGPISFKGSGISTMSNTSDNFSSYIYAPVACPGADETKNGDWRAVCPTAQQVWGKPQPHGSWALLFLNGDATSSMSEMIDLKKDLGVLGDMNVQDVWTSREVWVTENGQFAPPVVRPRDSGFYLLTKKHRNFDWLVPAPNTSK